MMVSWLRGATKTRRHVEQVFDNPTNDTVIHGTGKRVPMRIHTFEITRFPDNVKHTRIYKPTIKEAWQYIFSMLDPTDLISVAYLDSEDEEIPDNDDL